MLTNAQFNKYNKAKEQGKGITIRMSNKQLKYNSKVEGGFLGLLAGLAARALPMVAKTVLPALGVGALSGLASSGVQKAMGNGLYLKKGGIVSRVETDGSSMKTPILGQIPKSCHPIYATRENCAFPERRHHFVISKFGNLRVTPSFQIFKFGNPENLPSPERKGKTSLREIPIS